MSLFRTAARLASCKDDQIDFASTDLRYDVSLEFRLPFSSEIVHDRVETEPHGLIH